MQETAAESMKQRFVAADAASIDAHMEDALCAEHPEAMLEAAESLPTSLRRAVKAVADWRGATQRERAKRRKILVRLDESLRDATARLRSEFSPQSVHDAEAVRQPFLLLLFCVFSVCFRVFSG